MIEIKISLIPDLSFHDYTPSYLALIYVYLRQGMEYFPISLLPVLEMSALPTYRRIKSEELFAVTMGDDGRLGYHRYNQLLQFHIEGNICNDIEEGLQVIQEHLEKEQLVLVSGTTYYLPYSPDYQRRDYIKNYPDPRFGATDHWFIVHGINNKEIVVYDPIPLQYSGSIPLPLFDQFWKGNRGIPALQHINGIERLNSYQYSTLRMNNILPKSYVLELMVEALKTTAKEFVSGKAFVDQEEQYFGKDANEQLINDIEVTMIQGLDQLQKLNLPLSEMKYSRYFFSDLMQEYAQHTGELEEEISQYKLIVSEWERLAHKVRMCIVTKELHHDILTDLRQLEKRELRFHQKLIDCLPSVGLLPKIGQHKAWA